MREGTSVKVVRVRLIAAGDLIEGLARKMAALLESEGMVLIEMSVPYPCRPPDADKDRVYLMAAKKGD